MIPFPTRQGVSRDLDPDKVSGVSAVVGKSLASVSRRVCPRFQFMIKDHRWQRRRCRRGQPTPPLWTRRVCPRALPGSFPALPSLGAGGGGGRVSSSVLSSLLKWHQQPSRLASSLSSLQEPGEQVLGLLREEPREGVDVYVSPSPWAVQLPAPGSHLHFLALVLFLSNIPVRIV